MWSWDNKKLFHSISKTFLLKNINFDLLIFTSKFKSKLVKPESSLKQEKLARKVNYDKVKQNVNKWVPLIKQNRESVQVDLTDKTPTDDKRIQSSDIKLKHNDIGFKIGKVLNTL